MWDSGPWDNAGGVFSFYHPNISSYYCAVLADDVARHLYEGHLHAQRDVPPDEHVGGAPHPVHQQAGGQRGGEERQGLLNMEHFQRPRTTDFKQEAKEELVEKTRTDPKVQRRQETQSQSVHCT